MHLSINARNIIRHNVTKMVYWRSIQTEIIPTKNYQLFHQQCLTYKFCGHFHRPKLVDRLDEMTNEFRRGHERLLPQLLSIIICTAVQLHWPAALSHILKCFLCKNKATEYGRHCPMWAQSQALEQLQQCGSGYILSYMPRYAKTWRHPQAADNVQKIL